MLPTRTHFLLRLIGLLLLNACNKETQGTTIPPQIEMASDHQPSSQPASQSASQPASQPTSQPAEKPSDHPSTFEPIKLADLFAMPKTKSDIVIKVDDRTISRAAFETKLRVLQVQLTAAGIPKDLTREVVLTGAVTQLVEPLLMQLIAKELDIKLDQKLYNSQLEALNARINKDDYFKAFLKKAGNTPAQRAKDMKH